MAAANWTTDVVDDTRITIRTIEARHKADEKRIAEEKEMLRGIKLKMQALCPHDYNAPVKGYEHEGRNCKHCGVNDQFAAQAAKNHKIYIKELKELNKPTIVTN